MLTRYSSGGVLAEPTTDTSIFASDLLSDEDEEDRRDFVGCCCCGGGRGGVCGDLDRSQRDFFTRLDPVFVFVIDLEFISLLLDLTPRLDLTDEEEVDDHDDVDEDDDLDDLVEWERDLLDEVLNRVR